MAATGFVALIPARGGSKGVKRKNLALAKGKPLIVQVLQQVSALGPEEIFVSTEDPEISSITKLFATANPDIPVTLIPRPSHLFTDHATVDDVIADFIINHQPSVPLLVWQPTVLGVDPIRMAAILEDFCLQPHLPESWTMLTPEKHLHWTDVHKPPPSRHNRQDLDGQYQEVGVRLYPPGHIDTPIFGFVQDNIIDVDTLGDLVDADMALSRSRLVFQVAVSGRVGSGHLRRCLTLATLLQQYDITFALMGDPDDRSTVFFAESLLEQSDWKYTWDPADIDTAVTSSGVWVMDRLSTNRAQVSGKINDGWKVVTLEDLGPGARLADLTVNALYPPPAEWWEHHPYRHLVGTRYHVFRPEFYAPRLPRSDYRDLKQVLITFGGTDPAHLTERVQTLLVGRAFPGLDVRTVSPPGRPVRDAEQKVPMAAALAEADLVITSAGQTLYEAALLGTPAMVLTQNVRETTHAGLGVGNIHVGLGDLVSDTAIIEMFEHLEAHPEVRAVLADTGKQSIDVKGAQRIARRIEDLMEDL
jgi:spore coat polysaccharide biosynthesis predicted glycosyltransferase SpsG